ncbi:MAG: formate dehydrogenase subunit alpha, partial [Ardenticatenia bacterium]|nr:formate dehydrogenase subunit alpha [Ardenticatenia bacterium]
GGPPTEAPNEGLPPRRPPHRGLHKGAAAPRARRSKGLDAICPEAVVEVNTEDASNLGIADGQMVKVTSRRGEIVATAQVSGKVEPGVVFIPWHFAEAAANKLTIAALDPTAKIPEYKVCAVRVKPA